MADTVLGAQLSRQQRTYDDVVALCDSTTFGANANSTTGINFNIRKHQGLAAILNITACKSSATTETYVCTIEVSDVVGGSYTAIASQAIVRGTLGPVVIPLSGELAQVVDADCDWVRLTMTNSSGDSPSITLEAFLGRI